VIERKTMMASYCGIRVELEEDQWREMDGKVVEREFFVCLVRLPCVGGWDYGLGVCRHMRDRESEGVWVIKE
jgi:hypothetical protein